MATLASQGDGASASDERAWEGCFLERLCETSNVTASAKAAGVDASTVYRLRRESARFAALWREALCEGYDNLEMDLLCRLRAGELEPARTAAAPAPARRGSAAAKAETNGKAEAPAEKKARTRSRRRFDNAVGLRLLMAHRATVSQEKARREDLDEEAVLASINAKIDRIKTREVAVANLLAQDGVYLVADEPGHEA